MQDLKTNNSTFGNNILILRKKKRLTQDGLSDKLGVKRSTVGGYEAGTSTPDVSTLVTIAEFFDVSIDDLLKVDLGKRESDLKDQQETTPNIAANIAPIVAGKGKRGTFAKGVAVINATDAIPDGRFRSIPMLDARAAAGWPYSLDNSTFWVSQPTITLPSPWFQSGENVLIQVEGDSMQPTIYNGDWLFIRKLESPADIREGYIHVILTRDGIVCKRILNRVNKGSIALQSDNSAYPTYTVPVDEVLQIWKVEMKMSSILRNENLDLMNRMNGLEADMAEIKATLMAKKK